MLTVRARIEGDIERVFPDAKVQANKGTQAMSVSYPNFKRTVEDRKRHDAYMGVWSAMYGAQDR